MTSQSKKTHFGLIAQDIIEVLDEHNMDHTKNSLVGNVNDMYSLNYTEFIPILINSIQELKNQIIELKTEVDTLRKN